MKSNINENNLPLQKLLGVASIASGLQFGWALQSSLLTPYVQELGIPHSWASIIWLCGPVTGLFVQPLVGHMSDNCTGFAMGVLNLAIVIPRVVVSVGSGPWDELFGGGNSPAIAVSAVSAFASGLLAITTIHHKPWTLQ